MNISDSAIVKLLNQIFDLTKKIHTKPDHGLERNLSRIENCFDELGLCLINPIGESFNETRTDCEATIAGSGTSNLVIVEVIKPIIYKIEDNRKQIIQRGVVIVQSTK